LRSSLVHHPHATTADDLEHAVVRDLLADETGEPGRRRRRPGSLTGRGCCGRIQPLGRDQQAVSSPRQRLDVLGIVGRVAERSPEDPDRHIDAVIEVHDGLVGPELSLDLLAGDDLPLPLDQHPQDLEWLFPENEPAMSPSDQA